MKKPPKRSPKPSKSRKGADAAEMNQATTEDFEREDMGIASKE